MRKYLILSVFVITGVFQGFAGDKAEVWSRLYKRSVLPEFKYSIMLNIVELNDRAMIPLLEEILTEDIIANLDNKRSVTEERDFNELTKLVVRELGELKSKRSASLVYTIAKETSDPLLKVDAIVALGNMRATDYLNDISFILRNINMRPVKGKSAELEAESKIAYGAISALDRFKSIEGYSSVFFASIGWYDQRVKSFADKVLKTIVDNPIEALIPIITDGLFSEKEKAILEVAKCDAPTEDKAKAAREAMKQGLDNVAETIKEGMTLTSIRKNAIKVLYFSKSSDPEDVYYLSQSVRSGSDLEEKIYAIRTLGLNGSDEAIDGLVSILSDFNERSISGLDISYSDQDIIKEIIVTLGNTGNEKASGVLTEVQFSNYSSGIVKAAKTALSTLN
ncbi:HEAT repeat domain-containing protein [Thiospirochaeta perfilievii]|uniref:HEAT repeat domain-containing protein n=1 Tax=Thiospirochaeta perfilievii TaxID=252967 RepID=A0A5C1QF42_9SPIO|nr:HEAT repeat domain-containing protein [Thiospirochaeta perfilievii]QEN05720.1 HEAT repeat domain-containing protein [Thiospirochaeta perfilievii]